MARILAIALISLFICGIAGADWNDDIEILKAEAKPCALYSITENQVTYATSLQILGYKGFELNGMYSNDKDMPALGVGYEIANLKDLGVDVPLAQYVDLSVGGYVGCRDFTTEDRSTDWGIWATIVKVTF